MATGDSFASDASPTSSSTVASVRCSPRRVHVFEEIQRLAASCDGEDSTAAIGSMSSRDIEEIRKMPNPPVVVRRTLEATYMLLNASKAPARPCPPSWAQVQKMLSDVGFQRRMMSYDATVLRHVPILTAYVAAEFFSEDPTARRMKRSASKSERFKRMSTRRFTVPLDEDEPLSFHRVSRASQASAALFKWTTTVLVEALDPNPPEAVESMDGDRTPVSPAGSEISENVHREALLPVAATSQAISGRPPDIGASQHLLESSRAVVDVISPVAHRLSSPDSHEAVELPSSATHAPPAVSPAASPVPATPATLASAPSVAAAAISRSHASPEVAPSHVSPAGAPSGAAAVVAPSPISDAQDPSLGPILEAKQGRSFPPPSQPKEEKPVRTVPADAKPDRHFEILVGFELGRSELAEDGEHALQTIVATYCMRRRLKVKLVCNPDGRENDATSNRRIVYVEEWMSDNGIPLDRISVSEEQRVAADANPGVYCQLCLNDDKHLRDYYILVEAGEAPTDVATRDTINFAQWLEENFQLCKH